MYYVYIICSLSGRYYVGVTDDVARRVLQHNAGVSQWTARESGWRVVHTEEYPTLGDARRRELHIKRWKGGTAFKRLLAGSSGS